MLVVAIDATRCKSGGAISHLRGLLSATNPNYFGIGEVHLISNRFVLDSVGEYHWLKKHEPISTRWPVALQVIWQTIFLGRFLKSIGVDVLFSADASTFCRWSRHVVLHQDLLAFESGIAQRYRGLRLVARIRIIRFAQVFSLKRASAAIFLTNYAKNLLENFSVNNRNSFVISHGVDPVFRRSGNIRAELKSPIRLLYVSNSAPYKNHINVLLAFSELRKQGFDIFLDLVGGATGVGANEILSLVKELDPNSDRICVTGFATQVEVLSYLSKADIFVFASVCETLPITLLEAMASGLPVACSRSGPMPEVLGDGGSYFDSNDFLSISSAVKTLLKDTEFRFRCSDVARERSLRYNWVSCADSTWKVLAGVVSSETIRDS